MYVLTLRYVVKIIGCLDSYLFLYTVPTFGHGTPQGRGLLQYCSLDTSHGRSQLHMVEVYPGLITSCGRDYTSQDYQFVTMLLWSP